MPARTSWQKTIELFVDGLKENLPDWELAEIKRYVEKRCGEEAEAQMTVTPVGTIQHCSPISQTPVPPSGIYFNLENNEDVMGPELEKLESSSAGTDLKTPGQQCPPYEGIWEQGRTKTSGILTAGLGSYQDGRISTTTKRDKNTKTSADTSSNAATPENRKLKTFSEENKQFDPGRRKEMVPLWKAAVALLHFSAENGEAPCL